MRMRNKPYYGQDRMIDDRFYDESSVHYNVGSMKEIQTEEQSLQAEVVFNRFERKSRFSFNLINNPFEPSQSWTFPPDYEDNPSCPLKIDLIRDNCLRLRMSFSALKQFRYEDESPMLDGTLNFKSDLGSWKEEGQHFIFKTDRMTVCLEKEPFSLILYDAQGKELSRTLTMEDSRSLMNYSPLPLSYIKSNIDMRRQSAISLSIDPDEHFFGCGEHFKEPDKLGQTLNLWTQDPHCSESREMYKPVPFFWSTRGYGVFIHSGAQMTIDFGAQYSEALTAFLDDDQIDVFFFVGKPKEILNTYTDLTGKAPMLPIWSFGFWMSRITYQSEAEVREVARKLQQYEIPCDVICLDTGWFEEEWRCNYQFSSRFSDAQQLIQDLRDHGYKVSLWQIPYFTPQNEFYDELLERGLAVLDADGELITEDAILDFSNPETVAWYQSKLKTLFDQGVKVIKTDFGEAAPAKGVYHSGLSGRYEHNLYPIRYNKAASEITKQETGDSIVWARSAWAGSQRYPLHWGGDTEVSNMGMLSVLHGGLSLGNSGFSFWSHDAGGFAVKSQEELYRRWLFMSIFTSHIRAHGQPPKEPWYFSDDFLSFFRKLLRLRYRLMPYILTEAKKSSDLGIPLLRSLVLEFPDDRTVYDISDSYMFGDDLLIAPSFHSQQRERVVYLPEGEWINFFTGKKYKGSQWITETVSEYEGNVYVRAQAIIPTVKPALSTDFLDFTSIQWVSADDTVKEGIVFKDGSLQKVDIETLLTFEKWQEELAED